MSEGKKNIILLNTVMECFSDISSMKKQTDVLIAHCQSSKTLCSTGAILKKWTKKKDKV